MKVSVAGTGYVGLVSGVCLADKGHDVCCVDTDEGKVARINNAEAPIYEVGLDRLLADNVGTSLSATTDLRSAVVNSDVTLIAVGTPFDGAEIDVSYIEAVSRQIGQALREKSTYHVVIVKSTVVPGTTDSVVVPILEAESGKVVGEDFGVGMNPEFLREGEAISDFMNPDRIVLGGFDERTRDVMAELYKPFKGVDVVTTNNKTAEMIKYASNSLLATLISFSNEIANLCTTIGDIDAVDVMHGVHLDKRFSPIVEDGSRVRPASVTYLEAGCGFGGSCFPKDVKALIAHGEKHGSPMRLLDSVIEVNNHQPQQMLKMLSKHFDSFDGLTVAMMGLAFKPGTDDMRESPAIPIVEALRAAGATIRAYDPVARSEAEKLFGSDNIVYCDTMKQALVEVGSSEEADAVLLLTSWPQFVELPTLLEMLDTPPVLIDGRRMINKQDVDRYEGIGL